MQISTDLNNTSREQLLGLRALIDSLLGTTTLSTPVAAPNVPTTSTSQSGTAVQPTPTAPTPPAPVQEADEIDEPDAAAAAGAPERDSAGLPWDARIHSASRATVADGTWRRRKNTPDATYDSVMAELTAGNAPATTEVSPPPPTTDTTAPAPADTAPVAAAATTAADVPPPPPAATGPDLSTWPKFVQSVQSKDVPDSAKIYDALNKLAQDELFGVGKFLEMKDRPNDWAMFYDMVG